MLNHSLPRLNHSNNSWQFWIDRGGTFTDIVARRPDGQLQVHKLLSENPERYVDAPIQGIRDILGLSHNDPIPAEQIEVIKMGTTVANNALLERQGDPTVLLITQGFGDALRIGYQNRPDIFARHIQLPEMLYEHVIEVPDRYSAQGEELMTLETDGPWVEALRQVFELGVRGCAISLLHAYRYPDHEVQIANIAKHIGFTQISVSHQVSPLMKLISRGDTTVVDAYLSPILRRYVDQIEQALPPLLKESRLGNKAPRLMFMQSNGGLIDAHRFQGKDSILSGPAGGVVGAVKTCAQAGFNKIIGFDMGGTSTDVSHYNNDNNSANNNGNNRQANNSDYERTFETEVAGVRLRAPMMAIHTVAAGGGSVLQFDGARYRVGPASAGAYPGPACYRQGGPLSVTDCNVLVGKLQPEFFPTVFGPQGDLPLDKIAVAQEFDKLAQQVSQKTGNTQTPEEVAAGFLTIAVEKMASAIKKISIQRGYDVSTYTLCSFGGAGGQHACLIAEALGMQKIFLHPFAGVLSAYGIGLADLRILKEQAIETPLTANVFSSLTQAFSSLTTAAEQEILEQGVATHQISTVQKVPLRYSGTDSALIVSFGPLTEITKRFEQLHKQRYGFITPTKPLIIEAISVETIGQTNPIDELHLTKQRTTPLIPITTVPIYTKGQWHDSPIYQRTALLPHDTIQGPALIIEPTGTNVIEPGWSAQLTEHNHLILNYQANVQSAPQIESSSDRPNPVKLEIFNNLFRAVAEEMGVTLQNTSYSVNIKERLDFSCAIFDQQGQLVANAPHIPVHLGSMGESVLSLIHQKNNSIRSGDVYVSNNPYNGGTHLPDITVITPVFAGAESTDRASYSIPSTPIFYVASRGHHADIGGISPGSMPPYSKTIEQEGILIDNVALIEQGQFCDASITELLQSGPYPARNPSQNLSDLRAQVAANERGVQALQQMVERYGLVQVQAYMQHVQDNAEEAVRRVVDALSNGEFTYITDNGTQICLKIVINQTERSARIDFTGTSNQQDNNFNAPLAVCKAAVLYVFRTLVDDDIPLNSGCLKPLEIIVPKGCLLNPHYPAAVVAGNVETSQAITNALYGALGTMAASQGTMNNFTFGNNTYQYYETICGGAGAGPNFAGTDAVQTHMTNSRLTDPEILEWRFPVLVDNFSIRPNSGGIGEHSGGNGVIRHIRFREAMSAAIISGHRHVAPFGLQGGQSGKPGQNKIQRSNGQIETISNNAQIEMRPNDIFIIETPGGGGFGNSCSTGDVETSKSKE